MKFEETMRQRVLGKFNRNVFEIHDPLDIWTLSQWPQSKRGHFLNYTNHSKKFEHSWFCGAPVIERKLCVTDGLTDFGYLFSKLHNYVIRWYQTRKQIIIHKVKNKWFLSHEYELLLICVLLYFKASWTVCHWLCFFFIWDGTKRCRCWLFLPWSVLYCWVCLVMGHHVLVKKVQPLDGNMR